VRHTFPASTIIPAHESAVVFGGGTPSGIPGSVQIASTGMLALNNDGDIVTLKDGSDYIVASYTYGSEGGDNQSLARNPDITGEFVKHSTITSNSVLFSPGRKNTDGTALPVELSSFSAVILDNGVKLNWRTETEVNNYGFEILRAHTSTPLSVKEWDVLGFVEGSGNSNSPKEYSFMDNNVTAGKYSYRLKQIDTDGKFEYSKVIEVDLGSPQKFELSQNYPNPFNPVTTIRYSLTQSGNVKLIVYNLLGEQIAELDNGFKEAGIHTINFNAENLNSGIYIYDLEAGELVQSRKMLLVK
jgi:hypothetical protein